MQSPNNRRGLILAIAVAIVLIAIVGFILTGNKTKKNGASAQHVDSFSGETVSNPSGKAPDKYGAPVNQPLYLGFDKLVGFGMDVGQVKLLETAFYDYSQAQKNPIKQISVGVGSISNNHDPTNPNSPFNTLFSVQFDGSTIYKATAQYSGLSDMRLMLNDKQSGKLLYDSGVLHEPEQSE